MSRKYAALADRYADTVDQLFQTDANCRSTHPGVRKEIVDSSFLIDEIDTIADEYNARILEFALFRLEQTPRDSDCGRTLPTDSGWVSELWHSDNYPESGFKVLVYLTDVGKNQAPFEHRVPVRYRPRQFGLRWEETREASSGPSHVVLGPAGTTIIFKNNIIHKGNYCREGHRDVLMIGLALRGPVARRWHAWRTGRGQRG